MQNDFAAPDGATLERSMAKAKGIMTSPPHDGDWFCQWLLTMVDLPRLALAHGVGDAGQVDVVCVYEAENDCLSIEVYYETSHKAKMTVPLHSVRDFELNTRSFAATLGMPMFVASFADRTETKWTRSFKEWLKGPVVAITLKNRNGNGGPTPMVDVMQYSMVEVLLIPRDGFIDHEVIRYVPGQSDGHLFDLISRRVEIINGSS